MKTFMKKNITAYSGKDAMQDVVYRSLNEGSICIAAEYTKMRPTLQNKVIADNMVIIKSIWKSCSEEFKADLADYTKKLNIQRKFDYLPAVNRFGLFVKALYAYAKLNISNVSDLEYSVLKTSVVKNVLGMIDNDCLEKISDYGDLTALM